MTLLVYPSVIVKAESIKPNILKPNMNFITFSIALTLTSNLIVGNKPSSSHPTVNHCTAPPRYRVDRLLWVNPDIGKLPIDINIYAPFLSPDKILYAPNSPHKIKSRTEYLILNFFINKLYHTMFSLQYLQKTGNPP